MIALRAAKLTTLHVGAARPMWCAVVMRTTMCPTMSAGRSVSNFGIAAERCAALSTQYSVCELKKSRSSRRPRDRETSSAVSDRKTA